MQLTGHITPDSLMSLEAYSKWRKTHKGEVIAHRQLRSVALGEHLNVQFESELTIRYQIQEMLRIEKIFEEEGIQQEIEAYAPLVPDGHNWKATVLIEYMPAARLGDQATCPGPPDMIATGAATCLIGYMPAARVGDTTVHGGSIVVGCTSVLIGD